MPDAGARADAPCDRPRDRGHSAGGEAPRDHGGDLGAAMARFGGAPGDWIDLSTGVNPVPYPVGPIAPDAWTRLPQRAAQERFLAAAARAYACAPENRVVAAPGASALIALIPRLWPAGRAAIVSPTYNEHAASFAAAGWRVEPVSAPEADAAAEALVVVNPNNPDGRIWRPDALRGASGRRTLTVIDESFVDPAPELTAAARALPEGVVVLRSFGKFYGLAGLRLGAAIAAPKTAARLAEALGPWAVSGPALAIGAQALEDDCFAAATRARLAVDARRLDGLAALAGWRRLGGTPLFRLYETRRAAEAQDALARQRIWSRIFPYCGAWIRLGPPGAEADWTRLEAALAMIGPGARDGASAPSGPGPRR